VTLFLGAEPVALSKRAVALLCILVERAGALVSKDALIEAAWPGLAIEESNLTVQIAALRRALGEEPGGQDWIVTLPRRGYRFVGPAVTQSEAPIATTATADPAAKLTPMRAIALSDKPSIAVLPFENLSGDPNEDYFSDGITEDIITELSRFSELFVIARNSSFTYKSKAVDVRQVGRELGVRYVLEGSIRRAGDRVRIAAQLVDATTAAHLWAERFNRKLEDVFAVQDEIACTIGPILAAHVNKAEIERTLFKPPTAWHAHDYYLRAVASMASFYSSFQAKDLYEARRLLEASLSTDPTYARAYTTLSFTYSAAFSNPADIDYTTNAALDHAYEFAQKAVQFDPYLPQAHSQLGWVLIWKRRHEAAISSFERAIALNPNFCDWRFIAGLTLAGEHERALKVSEAYLRLDPFHPANAMTFIGVALFLLGRYSDALVVLLDSVSRSPNSRAHTTLAATYGQLGRLEEAQAEAREVLRIEPNYTITSHRRLLAPFKNSVDAENYFDGIRKAGLPE
jgi:adenylate cyclase